MKKLIIESIVVPQDILEEKMNSIKGGTNIKCTPKGAIDCVPKGIIRKTSYITTW